MDVLLASGDRDAAEAMRRAFPADAVTAVELASLTEPAAFDAVARLRPRALVCVPDFGRADLAEVQGCWWLARAGDQAGLAVVVVSTAEVFDGGDRRPRTEFDRPGPTSPRGWSALAAEQVLAESTSLGVVVRTGPLDVGARSIERLLAEPAGVVGGGAAQVTAVAATDVGVLVRELAVGRRPGVFHAAGEPVSLADLSARLGVAVPTLGSVVPPPPLEAAKPPMVGATPVSAWPEATS